MSDPKPADPKDDSFFRKVARFVANPTTDWTELNSRQDDPEGDLAKAELRAMVERKRRNDFVRKRELDMLRRIRREGLTPEQLAALGASPSGLDDGERLSDANSKIDPGVKAKIDEIEQQMVGENFATTQAVPKQHSSFFETSTRPAAFAPTVTTSPEASGAAPSSLSGARASEFGSSQGFLGGPSSRAPAVASMSGALPPPSDAEPSQLPLSPNRAPELPVLDMSLSLSLADAAAVVEVQELVHDPELDEAVIAFANGDYDSSEQILTELVRPGGSRNLHGETWLVLFDHYRATGAQAKFEALAVEYAQAFGLSAPQWFSMPRLVAESAARQSSRSPMGQSSQVSWTAPALLTADDVAALAKRCETLPMPWVLDWSALDGVEIEAAIALRQQMQTWSRQQVDQRWLGGEHLLVRLAALTPVGERDTDPALWMLRLEALRLSNHPDRFDEAAIDYCVTYEVSPPSWERALCRVRLGDSSATTSSPHSTMLPTEGSSSFLDTGLSAHQPALLELSGHLAGDIATGLLAEMTTQIGEASLVVVSCARLIRLDFMAAGDLLNWVMQRRSENRTVVLTEAHRLVALFFGAMGINEHAKVKVRIN